MYKATFEIPAIVQVEVYVDGVTNQVDALADAFDRLGDAAARKATVVSLSTDQARNVGLERLPETGERTFAQIPTPESVIGARRDGYTLHLYRGELRGIDRPGDLVLEHPGYQEARDTLVDQVEKSGREYGAGRIINTLTGNTMLTSRNPRGGWEVVGQSASGEERHSESWLDKATALSTARKLSVRDDIAVVVVNDFTDRAAGPKVFKRIA
ncbi:MULTISPECIES: hypothetical protein [unclassified Variovorax]|uniref:hypothetical protein n=1 Tax=unclassified Variovorax TaxID=663243 RepID=UPI00076D345B|nr:MULTISPECIES: hypothetical protein [unclassified Variovorax]KWT98430.1 hypothetical protein APY03_0565 [Variovorax sp. WDL1]PNG49901.1 hypothetical protein CHC06_05482 [Variovorax sp. B2]PNG50773.1 hypothetical protein CHC07_05387 [Variovorax sp. B4]VTU42091.1 hypothetical protein H6P1_00107 [Variovorax sp. PBL-H6]VTU44258.1 hypothetical protein SRS16P1_00795 [Variovorax sp. SRS16]